jgi:hypothetical protein
MSPDTFAPDNINEILSKEAKEEDILDFTDAEIEIKNKISHLLFDDLLVDTIHEIDLVTKRKGFN